MTQMFKLLMQMNKAKSLRKCNERLKRFMIASCITTYTSESLRYLSKGSGDRLEKRKKSRNERRIKT